MQFTNPSVECSVQCVTTGLFLNEGDFLIFFSKRPFYSIKTESRGEKDHGILKKHINCA